MLTRRLFLCRTLPSNKLDLPPRYIYLPKQPIGAHSDAAGTEARVDVSNSSGGRNESGEREDAAALLI